MWGRVTECSAPRGDWPNRASCEMDRRGRSKGDRRNGDVKDTVYREIHCGGDRLWRIWENMYGTYLGIRLLVN